MKKNLVAALVSVLALSLFVGCAKKEAASGGGSAPASKLTLVYSVNAVPGDAHHDAMLEFKRVVEAESNGSIVVETYDSGSLFKQDQEVAAVKSGQADIVYLSASWLTDGSPWIGMFTAGYIFKSYDDMTKTLNGAIGQKVFERVVKEQGVRPLCSYYLGTRQVNLREDKPVRTPADLRGVNLRMPNSDAWIALGRAMGANPTPIAFSELYMALQTGTVDGQENPLPTDRSAKFYEVTKSISLTNHLVDSVWPTINEGRWQSMTDEQKRIVMKGVEAGRKVCDEKNLKTESEIIDFFKGQGLSVYEADLNAFSTAVLDAYLNNPAITKDWDMDLFKEVQSSLN